MFLDDDAEHLLLQYRREKDRYRRICVCKKHEDPSNKVAQDLTCMCAGKAQ